MTTSKHHHDVMGRRAHRRAPLLAGAALLALAACASPEEKVERYTESGYEFLEKGDLAKANVQFQNALKINEDHVPAIHGVVDIAERKSDFRTVFAGLQRIVRLSPTDAEAQTDIAKLYLLGGEPASALEAVDAALALAPASADAMAVKAAIKFRLQNIDEARALAREALAADPGQEEAATVLATDLLTQQDAEGALKLIEATLAVAPKAAVLHLLRLESLQRLGREADLDGAYRNLIAAFPEEPGYRRLYATALIQKGDFDAARPVLVEVAALDKRVESRLDVVRIDMRMGGAAKARETFEAFIAENPDDDDLKFAYAAFLTREKDVDAARAIYDQFAARKDDDGVVARARNEIASLAMAAGDRAGAEAIISDILENDERNSDALMKRASYQIVDKAYDAAIANLRIVLADQPELSGARVLLSAAYEASGQIAAAEGELAQAFSDAADKSKVAMQYARFLLRHDKRDRAERVLAETAAANPGAVDVLKLLAALRLEKQDWRGAEETARLLEAAEEEGDLASRILGAAYTGLKDYAGAIEVLTQAHEDNPGSSRALRSLVNAYVDAGRDAEAEEILRQSVDSRPGDYEPRIMLAQVQARRGRAAEAKEMLRSAMDLDDARPEAYEYLYRIYRQEGRKDDAEALLLDGLDRAPENDGLRIMLADLRLANCDKDAAIAIYEDILTRRPRDLIASNNLASLLSETRDDPASRQRAADVAAVLADSENGYFLDTYGWALVRVGRVDEGVAALEKAVASAPDLVDAKFHLGVALVDGGDAERGRALLEEVAGDPDASPAFVEEARRRIGR